MMNYTPWGVLALLATFPNCIFADTFLPTAQQKYWELGLESFYQEVPGLRMSGAWLMNMGLPSLVSKIGVDLGVQFFPGLSRPAPEYGFFLESTVSAHAAYAVTLKTGFHTLAFPNSDASESSMSSVGIELGVQWNKGSIFWEGGLGTRYRDKDPERIEVGSEMIEKQWLFYPKIGVGALF